MNEARILSIVHTTKVLILGRLRRPVFHYSHALIGDKYSHYLSCKVFRAQADMLNSRVTLNPCSRVRKTAKGAIPSEGRWRAQNLERRMVGA